MIQSFILNENRNVKSISKVSFDSIKKNLSNIPKFKNDIYFQNIKNYTDLIKFIEHYKAYYYQGWNTNTWGNRIYTLRINNYSEIIILKDITLEDFYKKFHYKKNEVKEVKDKSPIKIPDVNEIYRVSFYGGERTVVFNKPKKDNPDMYLISHKSSQGLMFGDQINFMSLEDAKCVIEYLNLDLKKDDIHIFHPRIGSLTNIKMEKVKIPIGSGYALRSIR